MADPRQLRFPSRGGRLPLLCLALGSALIATACGQAHTGRDGGPPDTDADVFDGGGQETDAGGPPTFDGGRTSNAGEHCREERFWLCRRENFAGRLNQEEFEACLAPIDAMCEGVAWPAGCAPTPAETDACIGILMANQHIELSNEELLAMFDECDLCP